MHWSTSQYHAEAMSEQLTTPLFLLVPVSHDLCVLQTSWLQCCRVHQEEFFYCSVSLKWVFKWCRVQLSLASIWCVCSNCRYLANTMEEDEEEIKYEIFPWTLGKNWKKKFPSFLKQRDELWARMEYRAAVSRHCCEQVKYGRINGVFFYNWNLSIKPVPLQVMAISPSHALWQRERLEHHSGAQRLYGGYSLTLPRGPSASPVFCALCNHASVSDEGSGSSFSCSTSKKDPFFLNPFTATVDSENTYARDANHPSCCSAKERSSKYHLHNRLNSV